ncbi:hypothetical protein K492DRAFT_197171 [Lichtheimia hyalospora FSU 10163]|nr:hypothetical protein K492DRAFT_197171 [Lichtheimia hyalospora FSU 10163]
MKLHLFYSELYTCKRGAIRSPFTPDRTHKDILEIFGDDNIDLLEKLLVHDMKLGEHGDVFEIAHIGFMKNLIRVRLKRNRTDNRFNDFWLSYRMLMQEKKPLLSAEFKLLEMALKAEETRHQVDCETGGCIARKRDDDGDFRTRAVHKI